MKRTDVSSVEEEESPKRARRCARKIAFVLVPKVFVHVRAVLNTVPIDDPEDYSTIYIFTVGTAAAELQLEQVLKEIFDLYDPAQADPDLACDVPPLKFILDYLTGEVRNVPSCLADDIRTAPRAALGKWCVIFTDDYVVLDDGPYDALHFANFDPAIYHQQVCESNVENKL